MNCSICDRPTNMTVRDAKGNLSNCCMPCLRENWKKYSISVVWKEPSVEEPTPTLKDELEDFFKRRKNG